MQMLKQRQRQLGNVAMLALKIVGAAGLIALVAVTPGMGVVLKQFNQRKAQPYVHNVLFRLSKRGYIKISGTRGSKVARLTKTGRRYLSEYQRTLQRRTLYPTHTKWDGRWRIIIFDVPESARRSRDLLRLELRSAGFTQLQKSVWVSPYQCAEFIDLLRTDLKLNNHMLYIESTHLDSEVHLKKYYSL